MIPLVRPKLPSMAEITPYFQQSIDSGKFSNFGPCFDLLVERLNKRLNRYCLPVSDGTSAITLALQANLKHNSRVLIPDFTHAGTMCGVIKAEMIPIFGGCDRKTLTLSVNKIREMSKGIDAFVVVSPFGYRVDFEIYDSLARELGLKVIYDLAGGWGMDVKTKNPFTFSLHATKNFSCGEGGIVCFNEFEEWEKARRLSNFDTGPDRMLLSSSGSNSKASEWTCAVALAHLDAEHRILGKSFRKTKLISWYQAALKGECESLDLHFNSAPSLCVLGGFNAKEMEAFGKREGIEFKQYYIPLTQMPKLLALEGDEYFNSFVAFPSDVSEHERDQVIAAAKIFQAQYAINRTR